MATIQGKFVNDSGATVFEGSLVTEGAFDVTTPDVGSTETADSITIKAGDSATPGTGTGGSVTIQPGDGDSPGSVILNSQAGVEQLRAQSDLLLGGGDGEVLIGTAAGKVAFYGTGPVVKQTGVAVSAAAIHAALVNLGLIAA